MAKRHLETMTGVAFALRCESLKEMGCICCLLNMKYLGLLPTGYGIPEIHHLNEDGKHGNPRRGNRFTVPLCAYHHRGKWPLDPDSQWCSGIDHLALRYGPSWVQSGNVFREVYPSDDDMLAMADAGKV